MTKKITFLILFIIVIQFITLLIVVFNYLSAPLQQERKNKAVYKLIEESYKIKNYTLTKKLTEQLILQQPEDKRLLEIINTIDLIEKEQIDQENFNILTRFEKLESLIKSLSGKLDIIKKKNDEITLKQKQQNQQQNIINETIILNQSELEKAIEEGRKAFENNNLSSAKEKFIQALKYDNNNALANAYYGAVIYEENPESDKNINEASERIVTALKTDNYIEIAHLTLAKIYDRRGQKENAITEFNYAIKLNPNNFYTYYILGKKYYDDRNYEKARDNLLSSVRIKSDLLNGFYYLAESEINLSLIDEAKLHLEKVISLDNQFTLAYIRLGDLYFNENKYTDSVLWYSKANELNNNYETLYKIANCYLNNNQNEKSVINYQSSLSINSMITDKEKSIAYESFSKTINIKLSENNEDEALKFAKLGFNQLKDDGNQLGYIVIKLLYNKKKYQEIKEIAGKINQNKLNDEQKKELNNILTIINKK